MLDLANVVKNAVQKQNMLGWQYSTIGVSLFILLSSALLTALGFGWHDHGFGACVLRYHVSDLALTCPGMRFSLQSREIIADSIETVTCAQAHDACIALPGYEPSL